MSFILKQKDMLFDSKINALSSHRNISRGMQQELDERETRWQCWSIC